MGDRIAVLSERSRIEQFDTPARILANPANDYVRSFIGEGAALKRLALIPVVGATIGSADADAPAATVDEESSLREALDVLVLTGAPRINVTRGGAVVGSIDQAAISAALGATAPVRRTEGA